MTCRSIPRLFMSAAMLLAAAGCADGENAPLFVPTGNGAIAGQVFFDADNNGIFTPIGGDTVLADVRVELRERASDRVISSAQTDVDGRFSFAGVPVGTHDVLIAESTDDLGGLLVCLNPLRSSVYIGEQSYHQIAVKVGCVIRISAAKDSALSTPITIAGVVTVGQGTYRSDNAYIEETTGGILVFGIPAAAGLQVGDSVEITGVMAVFNNELQVNNPRVAPNIVRGAIVPVVPTDVTTEEIAASFAARGQRSQLVGRLLRIQAAQVGTFFAGSPARNAPLNGGPVEMRLDGNVVTALPSTAFTPGSCYDITGALGLFQSTMQIKPRGPSDVQEVPCP
jgi:hypothetical protein